MAKSGAQHRQMAAARKSRGRKKAAAAAGLGAAGAAARRSYKKGMRSVKRSTAKSGHSLWWWVFVGWWWYPVKLVCLGVAGIVRLCLSLGRKAPAAEAADPADWSIWDASVHQAEGQTERMRRAIEQGLPVMGRSRSGAYIVQGSTGTPYEVTFGSCTCEDFGRRHLPCKHIYSLAMKEAGFDPAPYLSGEVEP